MISEVVCYFIITILVGLILYMDYKSKNNLNVKKVFIPLVLIMYFMVYSVSLNINDFYLGSKISASVYPWSSSSVTLNVKDKNKEYYVSDNSNELKNGKWQDVKNNKVSINEAGIHFVFFRTKMGKDYVYDNDPKVVKIDKNIPSTNSVVDISDKTIDINSYNYYMLKNSNTSFFGGIKNFFSRVYHFFGGRHDNDNNTNNNTPTVDDEIDGPTIKLSGKTVSVEKAPSCKISYYEASISDDAEVNFSKIDSSSITVDALDDVNVYFRGVCENNKATKFSNLIVVKKNTVSNPTNSTVSAPVIGGSDGEWTKNDVTISVTTESKSASGIDHYEYNLSVSKDSIIEGAWKKGSSIKLTNSGIKYVYFRAVDKNGNKSPISNVNTVKIDKETGSRPTITGGSTTAAKSRTIKVTKSSSVLSGIKNYQYYLSTDKTKQTGGSWIDMNDKSVTITKNGTYYVFVRGISNVNTPTKTSDYQTVKISGASNVSESNPTAPVITGGSTNWTTGNVTVSIKTASTHTSGINRYEYYISTSSSKLENGSWTKMTNNKVTVSVQGTRYIFVRAVSNNTKYSNNSNYQVSKIDKTNPTTPKITGGGTSSSSLTVKVSTSSSATSGISYYEYYVSTSSSSQTGGSWTKGSSITVKTAGTRYVYFRAVSNVGLKSSISAYQKTVINSSSTTPVNPNVPDSISMSMYDSRVNSVIQNHEANYINFTDAYTFWDAQTKYPSKVNTTYLKNSSIYRDMYLANEKDVDKSFRYYVVKNGYQRYKDIKTNATNILGWGAVMLANGKSYPTETVNIGIRNFGLLGYNKNTNKWELIKKTQADGMMYSIKDTNATEQMISISTSKDSNGVKWYKIPTSSWLKGSVDYCFHFYDGTSASAFANYDYFITFYDMKIKESKYANTFVAYAGADKYQGGTAVSNIEEIGGSRFTYVTDDFKYHFFTNTPSDKANLYVDNYNQIISLIEK